MLSKVDQFRWAEQGEEVEPPRVGGVGEEGAELNRSYCGSGCETKRGVEHWQHLNVVAAGGGGLAQWFGVPASLSSCPAYLHCWSAASWFHQTPCPAEGECGRGRAPRPPRDLGASGDVPA